MNTPKKPSRTTVSKMRSAIDAAGEGSPDRVFAQLRDGGTWRAVKSIR